MRDVLPPGNGRLVLNLLAAGAVAALVAGCSSDSTRLTDPFSDPFTTSSTEPARHVASDNAIPAGRSPPVTSRSLPASTHVSSAAPLRPGLTRTAAITPRISHETTGSIEPARSARGSAFGGWTSTGGVPITIGAGETADVLSKRYGVPTTALLATNGLSSPSDIREGASLVIPVYNATAAAQPSVATHVADVAPSSARASLTKPVRERTAAAETRQAVRPAAKIAKAEAEHPLKAPVAEKPARQVAEAAPAPKAEVKPAAKKLVAAATPAPAPAVAKPAVVAAPAAKLAKLPAAAPAAPAPAVAQTSAAKPATPAQTTAVAQQAPVADASGNPEFRWPARGRIIQGFKGGNDGINIALPEGTAVKAAEGGTVAYAGSELKGYGNLVLIRHPNGYVTAYANNGELDVKRGDQVKRGQVIAKSGQTGNVSSPQLHFELRKGATPIDPTTYLAGL